MNADLETLSDRQLSEVLAVEACGWHRHSVHGNWYCGDARVVDGDSLGASADLEIARNGKPLFGASELIQQLSAHFHWWADHGKSEGLAPYHVEIQPKPDTPRIIANAETFERAAMICLIRVARSNLTRTIAGRDGTP